jgi:septal ring factor EnvC (AmiA/AmiB activator)
MDAETRAAFARMDRYFELAQAQHAELRAEVAELRIVVTGQGDRLDRQGNRLDAMSARMDTLEASVSELRAEIRERFTDVAEQFRTSAQRQELFEERVTGELAGVRRDVVALHEVVTEHGSRLQRLETGVLDVNTRLDELAADMRQRFRLVHERLGFAT